jgi:hypothetical protein
MGEIRNLKDEVTGTFDEVVGRAEGGVKGGLRVLKGRTKKGLARTRSDARRQTYRGDEVDETAY